MSMTPKPANEIDEARVAALVVKANSTLAMTERFIELLRQDGARLEADGWRVVVVDAGVDPQNLGHIKALDERLVLAVLHSEAALRRAAAFASGCRWRWKAIPRASVPPPCLRRPNGC